MLVVAVAAFAGASSLWHKPADATWGAAVTDEQGSPCHCRSFRVSEETDVKQITRTNDAGENWVVAVSIPARYIYDSMLD